MLRFGREAKQGRDCLSLQDWHIRACLHGCSAAWPSDARLVEGSSGAPRAAKRTSRLVVMEGEQP
jgi:hypothetical protein